MTHKKPIGEDGPIHVTAAEGKVRAEWRKIEHPPEKQGQELATATSFVDALNGPKDFTWRLRQLAEDDFDFEIESESQKRYLELQEIIIPPKKRGPPYAPGEQVI